MDDAVSIRYLQASWVVVCDKEFKIIKDGFVVFDKDISYVGDSSTIKKQYPNTKFEHQGNNSVLMPGLINAHTHLEFGANSTTLVYGDFTAWLHSVLSNRDKLLSKVDDKLIKNQLNDMLKSGTTSVGAISSYSLDIDSLDNSCLNTVCFVEVLGSTKEKVNENFQNFQDRLKAILEKSNIIPAVAIHSAYATHPKLVKKVIKVAKKKALIVQTHFMESCAEKNWLKNSDGSFKKIFEEVFKQTKAISKAKKFLNMFKTINNMSYTHCCFASKKHLHILQKQNANIIHCAKSNRLLGSETFNTNSFENIAIGTDGLSSNDSLDMFDELKTVLFLHRKEPINMFSNKLLYMATHGGARSLNLNSGELSKNFQADILSLTLKDEPTKENLCLSIILNKKSINQVYIKGKLCYG